MNLVNLLQDSCLDWVKEVFLWNNHLLYLSRFYTFKISCTYYIMEREVLLIQDISNTSGKNQVLLELISGA